MASRKYDMLDNCLHGKPEMQYVRRLSACQIHASLKNAMRYTAAYIVNWKIQYAA